MQPDSGKLAEEIVIAARDRADTYLSMLAREGISFPSEAEDRFRRVLVRLFTDGVVWILGGMVVATTRDLVNLDQIDVLVSTHNELTAVLRAAGFPAQTVGGDRAGQADPGTCS